MGKLQKTSYRLLYTLYIVPQKLAVKFFCLCYFNSLSFILATVLDSGSVVLDHVIRMTLCISSYHYQCCKICRAKTHS